MASLYRVRSQISYGAGGPGLVTHYWRPTSGGGTSTDAGLAAGGVRSFWTNLVAVLANSVAVLVLPAVDVLDDVTGALTGGFTVTPPAAVVGTGTSPYLPVFTSLVIRYNTATIVGTRRLEGRSFVGPLTSAASNAGLTPTTTTGTAATNAIAALLAVVGPTPMVWSRPRAAKVGPPVVTARAGSSGAIVGGSAWSSFGSLRSRRD